MNFSDQNPITLSFPESFETERLLIRSAHFGDGVLVNPAIIESMEELRPWMAWAKSVPTLEETEVSVRKARLSFLERTALCFHLFHKQSGEFMGSSGLHHINWQSRKFEIGYWLRTSCVGQGLVTEAVSGTTDFVINELQANRVEIRCDARNMRSAKVAERLGFALEAVLRSESCDVSGNLRDMMVFAKVRGSEF
ncbi:GNAT family N-acetyltransferase [Paenibacillus sp. SYP-B3998]|uniref:GNAT family N-acetyltransferase n=1 Tax=Paenibacillus sp. SYP-B3998 TaxID=2678564 RepID=A0A6G4A384_9BACL|nr:GNAT family N-acetyltransferase [Paenibacillus sp. SYP-B3998]NEW08956.1 GNAT family N-acetyltransferase [Paenibacillus sp. SYP-B3998]